MDRFKAIESFVVVANTRSFSGAAGQLGVSKAIISKRIMQLEDHLNVRLFHRTTRQFSLTAAGNEYLDLCSRLLSELTEEEAALSRLQSEPRGLLRIVSAKSFGTMHMASALAEFLKLYPDMRIEMELSTSSPTSVQLAEHGFEMGVRIIPAPADSRTIARKLADFHWVLCAAPEYIERHGAPRGLADLAEHRCLLNPRLTAQNVWHFQYNGRRQSCKVTPALTITGVNALRTATIGGAGIALLPTYCVADDIRRKTLIQVLPTHATERGTVTAVYPHARLMSAKVKLLTKFLASRFAGRF
ncbi:MAG: LysR substrate-binding domain-containing protein [Alphaproteobacteria bacterium]